MIGHVAGWWSSWVAHAVNGAPATGAVLGFCLGAVFTLVPATLAWVLIRALMPFTTRAAWLAAAVVLAAPNLLTLAVAAGTPHTAGARHAMDAAAPMFRGATLAGTLAAGVIVLAMMIAFHLHDTRRPQLPGPRTH